MKAATTLLAPITSLFGGGKEKSQLTAPDADDKQRRVKRERDAQTKYGNKGRVGSMLDKGKLG